MVQLKLIAPRLLVYMFLGQECKTAIANQGPGDWALKADIYPDDPSGYSPNLTPDHGFGWSVDYSGDTLIAGSYRAGKWDQNLSAYLPGGGSARAFVRKDSTSNFGWEQQGPPLVVNDGGEEYFGYRVAIDGNRALIAAGRDQGYGLVKMFIFERTNGSWAQTAVLEFPDVYYDNGQMPRVALEGDIAVVGRPLPTSSIGSGNANGKVFIYHYNMGNWNAAPSILEAPEIDRKDGDYFGADVAISNEVILVGADESEAWDSSTNQYHVERKGKAYIFLNNGNGWVYSQTLQPDISSVQNGFGFGSFVALDGDTALIGNNFNGGLHHVNGYCIIPIPVYEFKRNSVAGGSWDLTQTISSDSITSNLCNFGNGGVALNGNRALIGISGGETLLFEYGIFVKWLSPLNDHYGFSQSSNNHGKWLALGTNEAFVGRDRFYLTAFDSKEGSVHVYDTFSVIPLGDEVLTYVSSQAGSTYFSVTYDTGHGQQVQVELFKSDCTTPIENSDIVRWWNVESGWQKSLTHDRWYFSYELVDVNRLDEIDIFNPNTWQLQICHKAHLVSAPTVKAEQTLLIDINLIPEGVVAGSFGDPHIMTFDKLKFDCQAAGVFTMLMSLDSTFKIQETFSAVSSGSCIQASVSTGVAVTETGKPVIQISTPGIGQTSLNEIKLGSATCPIDFFVSGTASVIGQTDLSSDNVIVRVDWQETNRIKIIHTDTLLTVDAVIRHSATFGCHVMIQVVLPNSYRPGESLLGLLGTPNGDMSDDWVALDGSTIVVPPAELDRIFSAAYDYCVDNWCVQTPADSLFTLRSGVTFDDIHKCSVPYSGGNDIEPAVQALLVDPSINQALSDRCTVDLDGQIIFSLFCVFDGLCGHIFDATNVINDEWNLVYREREAKSSEFSLLSSTLPEWEVKAEITPQDSGGFVPNLSPDYGFGWSVAVNQDDTIIVGSYNSAQFDPVTQSYGPGQGSARVFRRVAQNSNISWEQVGDPLIVHDSSNPNAKYIGYRVAIDGAAALIAATREDSNGVKKSKFFVFELAANGSWEQTADLPIETLDDGRIPQVALQGDVIVIGAGYHEQGRVIVLKKLQSWAIEQTLVASDGQTGDYFGADVSISGDVILIGASQQDLIASIPGSGKAYIFVKSNVGNTWIEEAIIKPEKSSPEQLQFGAAVSLDGETAFIGCGNYHGTAYVYHRSSIGGWTLEEKLSAPNKSWDRLSFGMFVAVSGDLAVVSGGYGGETILYERNRSGWSVKSVMRGIDSYSSPHGKIVALGTDFVVVGGDMLDWDYNIGKVQVFDDFSISPPGPEEINLVYSNLFGSPLHVDFFVQYTAGYNRGVEFKLFEKDCQTAIPANLIEMTEEHSGRSTFSEGYHGYLTQFNPNTLVDSVVHNKVTGEIEVCAIASLIDSPGGVKAEDVFNIQFLEGTPSGTADIIFERSWTRGNTIFASYLIERDEEHGAQLFQKDCQTPIDDTGVIINVPYMYPLHYKYDRAEFIYTLDPNTARGSDIFNSGSSQIEVCHVVSLTNVPDVVDKQVMKIFVQPPGTFAGLFGDPHIVTFDGLSYDCQAAGEFTTLTSLEDDSFKIQERFTAIESGGANTCQASVSTGVVVTDIGKPKIQISTPRYGGTSLNMVNECAIDFIVDGTASVLLGIDLSSSTVEVTLDNETNRIRIKHTDTLLTLDLFIQNSVSFGCHIMVQVSLPASFLAGGTLLGLLGTPNGDRLDDWRTPNGTIITPPSSDSERLFSTAYKYCVQNWCAKTASDSLFVYRTGESFETINKCDEPFSSQVETAFSNHGNLNPDLINACEESLVCIVDGLCGDITDAVAAIGNEQRIAMIQASIFPLEETAVLNVQAVSNSTNCAGKGLSDFEGQLLNASCVLSLEGEEDATETFNLVCDAILPFNLTSCGVIKTSLYDGACSAGTPATFAGLRKNVSLIEDITCKNSGKCDFTHCFRIDYWYEGMGILSEMYEVVSIVTYASDGSWTVEVQTASFNAVDTAATVAVIAEVSARIGHCDEPASDEDQLEEVVIGSILAICVYYPNTTNEIVMLTLKDLTANPGGQTLVDASGNPNFVTEISDHGSSGVTVKTLMIPAYYDAQGGMAGYITFEGKVEVSYLGPIRHLVDGRVLEKVEEARFTLEVKLVREENPDVTLEQKAVHEVSAGSGSFRTQVTMGVLVGVSVTSIIFYLSLLE